MLSHKNFLLGCLEISIGVQNRSVFDLRFRDFIKLVQLKGILHVRVADQIYWQGDGIFSSLRSLRHPWLRSLRILALHLS